MVSNLVETTQKSVVIFLESIHGEKFMSILESDHNWLETI
jgi:hypothetical protein